MKTSIKSTPLSIFQMLVIASICCGLLVAVRMWMAWRSLHGIDSLPEFVAARGATFFFLIWNLTLAWVPYLAALRFEYARQKKAGLLVLGSWFLLWLFFLPNAPYLITDFIHFKYKPPVPIWYDLIVLFAYAGTGLLLGLMSIFHIHQALHIWFSKQFSNFIILNTILLSGFGIWLGRFQRWNSWDILTRPEALLDDVADVFSSRAMLLQAGGITILLSALLLVAYGFLLAMMGRSRQVES